MEVFSVDHCQIRYSKFFNFFYDKQNRKRKKSHIVCKKWDSNKHCVTITVFWLITVKYSNCSYIIHICHCWTSSFADSSTKLLNLKNNLLQCISFKSFSPSNCHSFSSDALTCQARLKLQVFANSDDKFHHTNVISCSDWILIQMTHMEVILRLSFEFLTESVCMSQFQMIVITYLFLLMQIRYRSSSHFKKLMYLTDYPTLVDSTVSNTTKTSYRYSSKCTLD